MSNVNLNSHAGTHKDKYGKFKVFFTIGDGRDYEAGWYWCVYDPDENLADDDPIGPYLSSHAAWVAATNLDFSINHRRVQ